jgi:hypothetical protein
VFPRCFSRVSLFKHALYFYKDIFDGMKLINAPFVSA